MAKSRRGAAPRDLGALFRVGTTGGLTDERLLERFVGPDPEAAQLAFAELVARHGPMVLRVCEALLRDPHDAEDAFQATFLVLARRSRSIRKRGSVASWLHGVARRVALSARSAAARRRRHERRAGEMAERSADVVGGWDDLGEVIQEEVQSLPEAYRTAIVLCDLEGLTEGQAAQQLGWPIGTVRTRLTRARERLRGRLTRRGLAPSIVGAALAGPPEAALAVPAALRDATIHGAVPFATSEKVPIAISTLTERVLRDMFLTRLKITAAALITIGAASSLTLATVGPTQEKAAPTPPAAAQQPPARLSIADQLEQPVPMVFPNEIPLSDVLGYLKQATRGARGGAGMPSIPIYVDPLGLQAAEVTLNTTVAFDAENTPLRVTLARLLSRLGLEYAVKDDVLIISSPRRIDEERKETAAVAADHSPATETVLARLAEPIPMPFAREVPLDFALRTIEQATRNRHPDGSIPFLVDAVGLKEVNRSLSSTIVMDLEGVSLKTTLRLMLKQVGLAYIVKDGLVIVSSPKRLEPLQAKSGSGPRSTGSAKG
jgi:RNA polymerase sigma factor (sigma-70 family)